MNKQIPKGYSVLRCEFCRQDIALFKPENLKRPLNASMFEPFTFRRGLPKPFPFAHSDWKDAQCPYCKRFDGERYVPNRPWAVEDLKLGPDKVRTPYGHYIIGSKEVPHKLTQSEVNQQKIVAFEKALRQEAVEKRQRADELKRQLEEIQEDQSEPEEIPDKLYCQYCGKELLKRGRHESVCPKNPKNLKETGQ